MQECVFEMTLFITITKPISWVLSFIPAYGMRAAGDVKFSMITSCASMWLCRVSSLYSYAVYMALVLLLYGLECLPTDCARYRVHYTFPLPQMA